MYRVNLTKSWERAPRGFSICPQSISFHTWRIFCIKIFRTSEYGTNFSNMENLTKTYQRWNFFPKRLKQRIYNRKLIWDKETNMRQTRKNIFATDHSKDWEIRQHVARVIFKSSLCNLWSGLGCHVFNLAWFCEHMCRVSKRVIRRNVEFLNLLQMRNNTHWFFKIPAPDSFHLFIQQNNIAWLCETKS